MKNQYLVIPVLLWIISAVSATLENTTMQTTIVDSPYLDINIWMLITLLGLGFMILSNFAKPEQNSALWAIIAPFFLGASAYFTLQLQYMAFVPVADSSNQVHIFGEIVVFHPIWFALVMGIVFIFSCINLFYILTKKPIEKPGREEIYGGKQGF